MTSVGTEAWHIVYDMLRQFSRTLHTDLFSTETSNFLKQIIFLKPFNSSFDVYCMALIACYVYVEPGCVAQSVARLT